MRIVEPSARIWSELNVLPISQRIEACGRICYKSESRITKDSAGGFLADVLRRGHLSVLEMASITIEVSAGAGLINDFITTNPRYFAIDWMDAEVVLITGSIRAYYELFRFAGASIFAAGVCQALHDKYPHLFSASMSPGRSVLSVREVTDSELVRYDAGINLRHRRVAVKFVVNRAVSHELVRHRPVSFLQESQRYCRYSSDKFGAEVSFVRPCFFDEDSPAFLDWYRACNRAEAIYMALLAKGFPPQAARTVLPNSTKTELVAYCDLSQWQHILNMRTGRDADPSMRQVMVPLLGQFRDFWPDFFDFVEEAA